MDISFHDSSRRILSLCSVVSQNYEDATMFSEYSTLVEYNPNSTVNYICSGFKDITKHCSDQCDYLYMTKEFCNSLYAYLDIIKKNLNMLSKPMDSELSNLAFIIQNEVKTWKLVNLLYHDRINNKSIDDDINLLNADIVYSELEVLRKVFQSNKELREAHIVIDWLECCLREKIENNPEFLIGSHGKSWEHTKYFIRKQNMFNSAKNKMINQLDPDAPLRGGLVLDDRDKSNENEYFRYLFHCVQSGDYDRAQSVCLSHDELWRAQTLEGWKPFHNPFLRGPLCPDTFTDISGNPNRKHFKFVCRKLSENICLNLYERAIYAIYAGNLDVLTTVETDWSGLLWAHFKTYIESMVEHWLSVYTNNGIFNTQSLFGDDDLDISQFGGCAGFPDGFTGSVDRTTKVSDMNFKRIFNEISLKIVQDPISILHRSDNVDQGRQRGYYQSVFQVVQQYIILEDITGLLEQIDFIISHLPTNKTASDKNIIRFLTHLVIFMYSTHEHLPAEVYHKVLEKYIECLLEEKWLDNVAFYVSKLSTDLQIKWYCKCLYGVVNYEERRKCVHDGLEYDLPMVEITRLLVESVRINRANLEMVMGSNTDNYEDRLISNAFVTETDKIKIDILDWLTFFPDQQYHLIRQANAFCRLFLEADKLQAAKMVMNKISDDVWSYLNINATNGPKWLSSALYENECLRKYIECHDLYGDWYNNFTCQKPEDIDLETNVDLNQLSFQEKQFLQKKYDDYRLSLQKWEKLNDFHGNKAFDGFYNVLKMGSQGWLSDVGEDSFWLEDELRNMMTDENDKDKCYTRKTQINQLRKKCIVVIVFMAVKVMMSINQCDKCFSIIDLLADDKYQLFKVFEKKQLQNLLSKIRECSLQLMAAGKDAFGIEF